MKVNRVFCYSKEVAKQNGNKLPILALILSIILGIFALVGIVVIEGDNFNGEILTSASIAWIFSIAWTFLITYFGIILGLRLRSRMTGYATDEEGRIFKAMIINNGQGLYFGGVAAGGMIDQLVGNDSSLGESLGGVVGAAAQFYSMNRSAKYMSHPEIVAKMVESAPNITGAEVIEILKVYSIINKKKSIKIKCDYRNLRNNKIKCNKSLVIEKSFNMFDDLANALNTHR